MGVKIRASEKAVGHSQYRALAQFRYYIRRYLDSSDKGAKAAGLEPGQYQLMLAIEGLADGVEPTVGALAEQLHIRHHSAVELVNRAERKDLVERSRRGAYVLVLLTKKGERTLARAVNERLKELRVAGPALVKALQQLARKDSSKKKKRVEKE
jgi:DNA-binding MarR family transcriptional regulator